MPAYTPTTYSSTVTAAMLNNGEAGIDAANAAVDTATTNIAAISDALPINPKDSPYNAVFDGTTDDTAAINAAIVAAEAAGRIVELPKGTAVINPAVKLTMLSEVHLRGQGVGVTTLLMKPNSATTAGVWSILNVDQKDRWSVTGITFDGNRRNGNHGASEDIDGIHAAHSGYFEIAHCEFKNFRAEGVLLSQQNPYSTGTASVTNGSATVTGSGTSWNTGGLGFPAVGQIVNIGSPLGRNYTIQSIGSNTSITLTETYKGATASGQSYAIAPPRPHHFSVHHNVFTDCGVPVSGDANVVGRMGLAAIACEDFDISHNSFDTIGSVGIDLEPNLATQIVRNGTVADNSLFNCVSFFINVAPAATGPASSATGLAITGNVGRGSVPKAYVVRATNSVISANVALECEQVGVQAVTEAGGPSGGLVITDNVLNVTGPSPLAGIYLDSATGCAVLGNVLPSTLGTAAVIEAGTADNNVLGPDRIGHTGDYVRVGASTQTFGKKLLRFGGSEGRMEAAGGVLYLRSGAANDQIIFEKSNGTEDARIDGNGHLLMNGARQVKAGAFNLATAVTAASMSNNTIFRDSADNVLKTKDNAGTVAAIGTGGSGIAATIADAKGDLIVATAADTVARLAVGSDNQILRADSTATSGLAWVADVPATITVRTASTANVTISPGGASLSLGGITVANDDLVLLKDQTAPAQNGPYVVGGVGSSVTLTRASELDASAEFAPGLTVFVRDGTHRGSTWQIINTALNPTVGTTAIYWTRVHPAYRVASDMGTAAKFFTGVMESHDRQNAALVTGTVTSGTVCVSPLGVLRAGHPLASLTYASAGTAATSPTNQWAGICNASRVIRGISANGTTGVWATFSTKTFTLGSAYTPAFDELLYHFIMVAATTPPSLCVSNMLAAGLSAAGTSDTGQTTPPASGATLGALTARADNIYCLAA